MIFHESFFFNFQLKNTSECKNEIRQRYDIYVKINFILPPAGRHNVEILSVYVCVYELDKRSGQPGGFPGWSGGLGEFVYFKLKIEIWTHSDFLGSVPASILSQFLVQEITTFI